MLILEVIVVWIHKFKWIIDEGLSVRGCSSYEILCYEIREYRSLGSNAKHLKAICVLGVRGYKCLW